jgi:agmatine deiminase
MKEISRWLPPEWAPQSGVMLTWPHNQYWQPVLAGAEKTFAQIAATIARFESVVISCLDKEHATYIRKLLKHQNADMDKINLYIVPSNDAWVRDHGPVTVLNGSDHKPILLDFIFNSWGNKYPCEQDNQLTQKLKIQQAFGDTSLEPIDFVLEGGSIERGTLLTTSRCLLSPTRNPGLDKTQIAEKLETYLGIKKILWLEEGHLDGDDTDSHIDTLARFTDENTLCYIHCDDPEDSHYEDMTRMRQALEKFRSYQDKPYRLIPLPWPRAKFSAVDGRRLPATYANFLIINQAVLLPVYNDPADLAAISQMRKCFPEREIIAINCENLIENFGSLHCVTMQLPQGVIA